VTVPCAGLGKSLRQYVLSNIKQKYGGRARFLFGFELYSKNRATKANYVEFCAEINK
jgi:hypothetical protein